jgi:hypothetical protein
VRSVARASTGFIMAPRRIEHSVQNERWKVVRSHRSTAFLGQRAVPRDCDPLLVRVSVQLRRMVGDMRYLSRIPKKIRPGQVIEHNHIAHGPNWPTGPTASVPGPGRRPRNTLTSCSVRAGGRGSSIMRTKMLSTTVAKTLSATSAA